ncbi:AraC family transcriptional regulator [Lysobacter sp. Root494]|uniref:AraC family transcriptional regulator n=1 Tax=Lysobacter sp. Root494 TaxID=1736549 RepID=UPI0006F48CE5|nr:AraC family transcriptional regulator [Lysobacter sp. Root494]KQY50453.1 AraC family transcriptional regulator [Lysobacter sp. Root494]
MAVPFIERPLCEPVELRPGTSLRIERVRQDAHAAATEPFPHFHDVHELVLFGQVQGDFFTEGWRYPLSPGCIAFVPSMRQHDFALAPGSRDWVLVQVDAVASETLLRSPGLERLARGFCALPERRLRQRIATLANWLTELDGTDPAAVPLVELLLRAAAQAPQLEGERVAGDPDTLNRLRPAIERLRRNPADAPSAEAAAALCALAPAYFSRRFKQQIGLSWSEYVRTHRLHLASQRLLASDEPIVDIAYGLGFSTPSHFGEVFHQRFGLTPREYRLSARRRAGDAMPPADRTG